MARSHLRKLVRDAAGSAIQNAKVNAYKAGTLTALTDLWTAASGGSSVAVLTTNDQGEVEGWLDNPKAVDLVVSDNAHTAFYPSAPTALLPFASITETVEVLPPPAMIVAWRNIRHFGALIDGSDDTAAWQAAIDDLPATGGVVYHPGGTSVCASPLNANGKRNVIFVGVGGVTGGAASGSVLQFSSAGSASQLPAQSSFGFHMQDMTVEYTNAGFTGTLVDITGTTPAPTQQASFLRVLFKGVTAAGQTAKLVNCDKAIVVDAIGCHWNGGGHGMYGKSSNGSFSNVITVLGGQFVNQDISNTRNAGESWKYVGVTQEALRNGQARAFDHDTGVKAKSLSIDGGWMGDVTDVTNDQSWITFAGTGLTVDDATISGSFAGTFHVAAVTIDENGADGIHVGPGCTFSQLRAIVDFGATVSTTLEGSLLGYGVAANVANPVLGTIPPQFKWAKLNRPLNLGPDLELYRGLANLLYLKGGLSVLRTSTSDQAFSTQHAAGDNFNPFQVDIGGTMQWGTGTLAPDVTLYRDSADVLRTDDALIIGGGTKIAKFLSATKTWDPASVASGTQTSTTLTVTGAAMGDTVTVSFTLDLQLMVLTGYVSAANTVTVILSNNTGGPIDLGSGTLRADAWQH